MIFAAASSRAALPSSFRLALSKPNSFSAPTVIVSIVGSHFAGSGAGAGAGSGIGSGAAAIGAGSGAASATTGAGAPKRNTPPKLNNVLPIVSSASKFVPAALASDFDH